MESIWTQQQILVKLAMLIAKLVKRMDLQNVLPVKLTIFLIVKFVMLTAL